MSQITTPSISVIMPVYNAQETLARAVESVLNQSHKDFELILVNDCSTDDSLKVCRELAQSDSRIVIVDKPTNEGASKARFSGVEASRGEYLTFVDSDDALLEGALQTMYSLACEHNCDMVRGDVEHTFLKKMVKKHINKRHQLSVPDFEGVRSKNQMLDIYRRTITANVLNFNSNYAALYRRSLFLYENVRPVPYFWGDDLILNLQLIENVQRVYVTGQKLYLYCTPTGSLKFRYDEMGQKILYMEDELRFLDMHFKHDLASRQVLYKRLVKDTVHQMRQTIRHCPEQREQNIRYYTELLAKLIYRECFRYVKPHCGVAYLLYHGYVRTAYQLSELSVKFTDVWMRHISDFIGRLRGKGKNG